MDKIKIAASTYLNSAPLIYSFVAGTQQHLCHFMGNTAPARCADMLSARLVDAALIPAIEYQRITSINVISNISVAAKNVVRSVLLVARKPITLINSVILDTASRTSAILVRILLEHYYHLRPLYSNARSPLSLMTTDSALIIGDPAMTVDRTVYYVYDLAEEWRRATGLPFVFALWAIAGELPLDAQTMFATQCMQAKQEGLNKCSQIAQDYGRSLHLPVASLTEYLTNNINYDLDEENLAGLNLFYQIAAQYKLIDHVKPLNFV